MLLILFNIRTRRVVLLQILWPSQFTQTWPKRCRVRRHFDEVSCRYPRTLYHCEIDGFRCYSQDKRCSAHGGLLTYISEDLQACKINLNIDPTVWEGVFIRIKDLENQKDLVLGNIYRPPHDNNQINTRMWNMISSPATPTVCLEHKPENVQSRNVTLSMPSQSKK